MAEPKPSTSTSTATSATPQSSRPSNQDTQSSESSGKGDFVNEGSESYEKGYWGTRDNPFDDEEFALTTGPDAPLQDSQGNPVDVDGDHIESEPKE